MKGINLGKKNGMWTGNNVKYRGLHDYIKYHLKKPLKCQDCNLKKSLDLANISGKYKRSLKDWEWLCRKCHMKKDGRLSNLEKRNKSKRSGGYKLCILCEKEFYAQKRLLESQKWCGRKCYDKYRFKNKL